MVLGVIGSAQQMTVAGFRHVDRDQEAVDGDSVRDVEVVLQQQRPVYAAAVFSYCTVRSASPPRYNGSTVLAVSVET